MAGEIAVQPSFQPETPKPQGKVERAKQIISLEKVRQRRETKKAERAQYTVHESRVSKMDQDRKTKYGNLHRALNLHSDNNYSILVSQERQRFLTEQSLSSEMAGNQFRKITPTQEAGIQHRAYERFVKDQPHAAEYYRRQGLYFTKPDKDGNCRVDFRADPYMRTIDMQIQALQNSQVPADQTEARRLLDTFVKDAPEKARIYAAAGHKGLREAIQRMDASPMPTATQESQPSTPKTPDAPVTIQSNRADQVRRIQALATKQGGLTFREQNELKTLRNYNAQEITDARALQKRLEDPNGKPLEEVEIAKLEAYAPLLSLPDAAPAATASTPAETEAEKQARETKERVDQKILGLNAFTELTSKLGDLSGETEQGMLDKLTKGEIKNPDGSVWQDDAKTQEYIKAAFTEKALLDATEAAIPQATRDKLKQNGLNILELLLAMATAAALTEAQKAIAITP